MNMSKGRLEESGKDTCDIKKISRKIAYLCLKAEV